MRSRLTPRDDDGNARRFVGHGEALRWIFLFTARNFGRRWLLPFLLGPVVVLVFSPFIAGRSPFEGTDARFLASSALLILLFLLLAYLGVSAILYLYTLLAGGIMSREERERKQDSLPR